METEYTKSQFLWAHAVTVRQIGPAFTAHCSLTMLLSDAMSRHSNGIRAERPGFDFQQGNNSLFHSVQTDPGAQPASYPEGTGASFPEGKTRSPSFTSN
jgi:hypothetical protein